MNVHLRVNLIPYCIFNIWFSEVDFSFSDSISSQCTSNSNKKFRRKLGLFNTDINHDFILLNA